jgi:hypothetical protein
MPAKYPHVLSKSRFVSGVQCSKKLFLELNRKDLKPAITASQQAIFDQGHAVGKMAQERYPNGIDLTSQTHYDYADAIDNTLAEMKKKTSTLYEAAFYYDEVLSVIDILEHDANGDIHAIEVKSSGSVSDNYITDASLQYWVMANSGCAPKRFSLLHINSSYVKNGAINLNDFFTPTDITDLVIQKQAWVTQHIEELKQTLQIRIEPIQAIGRHCNKPFVCDFKSYCWGNLLDKDKVFNLSYGKDKIWRLYNDGILNLADIPDDFELSHRQSCQVNGQRTGAPHIDSYRIHQFLNKAVYPLYFFDFETVNSVVPVLDGTSPFEQVGFQYSLHIVSNINEEPQHKEFLARAEDFTNPQVLNPRLAMINQMKLDFGTTGSIVSYNASFEKGVIEKLAIDFPDDKLFLRDLNNRMIDLLDVFRNAWYYVPKFGKSASIKDVLPALVPNLSYKTLAINNGDLANKTYMSMIDGTFNGDVNETRNNLLAYCKLDTLAMVEIWKALCNVI